jgi:hypothetical protein
MAALSDNVVTVNVVIAQHERSRLCWALFRRSSRPLPVPLTRSFSTPQINLSIIFLLLKSSTTSGNGFVAGNCRCAADDAYIVKNRQISHAAEFPPTEQAGIKFE